MQFLSFLDEGLENKGLAIGDITPPPPPLIIKDRSLKRRDY